MGVKNDLLDVVGVKYVRRSNCSVSEYLVSLESRVNISTGGWIDLKFTPGTASFKDTLIDDGNAGPYYQQEFVGRLPGKAVNYPAGVFEIVNEPVVVRLELINGVVVIVGSNDNSVKLRSGFDGSKQEVVFKFSRECKFGALLEKL